jgi:hypothetical protein
MVIICGKFSTNQIFMRFFRVAIKNELIPPERDFRQKSYFCFSLKLSQERDREPRFLGHRKRSKMAQENCLRKK